jgi:hypothetical protein
MAKWIGYWFCAWFRISRHLSKKQNGRHKQRSGQHTLSRKKYAKFCFLYQLVFLLCISRCGWFTPVLLRALHQFIWVCNRALHQLFEWGKFSPGLLGLTAIPPPRVGSDSTVRVIFSLTVSKPPPLLIYNRRHHPLWTRIASQILSPVLYSCWLARTLWDYEKFRQ